MAVLHALYIVTVYILSAFSAPLVVGDLSLAIEGVERLELAAEDAFEDRDRSEGVPFWHDVFESVGYLSESMLQATDTSSGLYTFLPRYLPWSGACWISP